MTCGMSCDVALDLTPIVAECEARKLLRVTVWLCSVSRLAFAKLQPSKEGIE